MFLENFKKEMITSGWDESSKCFMEKVLFQIFLNVKISREMEDVSDTGTRNETWFHTMTMAIIKKMDKCWRKVKTLKLPYMAYGNVKYCRYFGK